MIKRRGFLATAAALLLPCSKPKPTAPNLHGDYGFFMVRDSSGGCTIYLDAETSKVAYLVMPENTPTPLRTSDA